MHDTESVGLMSEASLDKLIEQAERLLDKLRIAKGLLDAASQLPLPLHVPFTPQCGVTPTWAGCEATWGGTIMCSGCPGCVPPSREG